MESHPVPQNVTEFEFHLVGDMTLKQFTYLASGLTLAYLIFAFLAPKYPILSWPLIIIFALIGVAFAFLPIAERPLDHWVSAFFRAIFNPTQRFWQSKRRDILRDDPIFKRRLQIYLKSVEQSKRSTVAPKVFSMAQFAPITQGVLVAETPKPVQEVGKIQPPLVKPESVPAAPAGLSGMVELAKEAQVVQSKIITTEKELEAIKMAAAQSGANPADYANKFQEALGVLRGLTVQASGISQKLALVSNHQPAERQAKVVVVTPTKTVASRDIVLTSTPNVINGIVTDWEGNYLEGAIIVTHDKEGLPVRALKSNKLGQFVAATPLPNGVYRLTVEKEGFVFDDLQVTLEGSVLLALRAAAKKMGV